jgi:hypothetical protein
MKSQNSKAQSQNDKRELLAKEVERAFANTVYPGDDYVGRDEVREMRGHWHTIPKWLITHAWSKTIDVSLPRRIS